MSHQVGSIRWLNSALLTSPRVVEKDALFVRFHD
jgi:hypothetical protein